MHEKLLSLDMQLVQVENLPAQPARFCQARWPGCGDCTPRTGRAEEIQPLRRNLSLHLPSYRRCKVRAAWCSDWITCAYPNFNPSSTSQQLFCLWVSLGFSAQEGNILPAGRFIAASAECLYFQLRLTRATSEALFGEKKKSFPCRLSPDGGPACLLCHSCSRNLSLPFSSCYSGLVFRRLVSVVGLKLERVLAEFGVVFCGFIWPG